MRDLQVDEVLAAAAELLGRGTQSPSNASARRGDRDPS
jgi:hypothetical protein